MNDILSVVHLFSFGAALASLLGYFSVLRLMQRAPGDRSALARMLPLSARTGQVGLGILWLSGLAMVWSIYGGPHAMPPSFWWKMLCVVLLTAAVAYRDVLGRRAVGDDKTIPMLLPLLGKVCAALLLLVVVFAVVAFS